MIEEEKKIKLETLNNIKNFERKIKEKKLLLGGINAGQENQNTLTKQVSLLKLD